ncbi:hypothetical protein AXG93_2016s1310 [Marchantia polymorpha subsp. ruderalis]|uniref:Uncharacterized protein n=1 Tax=Marchantia polymorpha subsp. ruderalis TaxID=1480154 RepID=A0A176VXV4_MARPO|nr:hypothetical protein AXG93_2016s1310 [Marchantia polymorpha subsp. ruderalis]
MLKPQSEEQKVARVSEQFPLTGGPTFVLDWANSAFVTAEIGTERRICGGAIRDEEFLPSRSMPSSLKPQASSVKRQASARQSSSDVDAIDFFCTEGLSQITKNTVNGLLELGFKRHLFGLSVLCSGVTAMGNSRDGHSSRLTFG